MARKCLTWKTRTFLLAKVMKGKVRRFIAVVIAIVAGAVVVVAVDVVAVCCCCLRCCCCCSRQCRIVINIVVGLAPTLTAFYDTAEVKSPGKSRCNCFSTFNFYLFNLDYSEPLKNIMNRF